MLLLSCFMLSNCGAVTSMPKSEHGISPYDYGLREAKTGEERYYALLRTHKTAVNSGNNVEYSGITSLDITVPNNAESIPLTSVNDFKGLVLNVTNLSNDFFLFSYYNKADDVYVSTYCIDNGDYSSIKKLSKGRKLLVIIDKNPWVNNRKGYGYGHVRKDIVLLKNGKAQNKPIMPYNNKYSKAVCKVYDMNYPGLTISNLTFNRSSKCKSMTFLFDLKGVDNVEVRNVVINTPPNDMVNDQAIRITDCSNVTMENVAINGTYSRTNHSGYGICMDNVWKYRANKLFGKGNWGIFGNNNINDSFIEKSEINRFDIHCYGRDVAFKDVKFVDLYNQFSSVYGTISFDGCVFDKFTPILYESSYNTYNEHRVSFENCSFIMDKYHHYFIRMGNISETHNARNELSDVLWPEINMHNVKVILPKEVKDVFLFSSSNEKKKPITIDSIKSIDINSITFLCVDEQINPTFYLSNLDVSTKKRVPITITDVTMMKGGHETKASSVSLTKRVVVNIKSR